MSRAWLGTLLAAAAMGVAAPASAISITVDSVAVTANNTADTLSTVGANRSQFTSTLSLAGSSPGPVADVLGASVGFSTVYSFLLAADREAGGGSNTFAATMEYEIVFTVDNPTGVLYQLDVDTSFLGALVLVDDGSGDATATLSGVSGLLDGAGDPGLATGAPGTLAASGGGYQDVSLSNTLTIVESAVTRQYTLTFGFTGSVTSAREEAAILGGIAGSLGSTLADDYPGVGGRTAAGDGHQAGVTATVIPEPPTALLVLSPLVSLAALRRRG
jgi:hypothetical protein